MSKPLPLSVFDRETGQVFEEFRDSSPGRDESERHRSLTLQPQLRLDWLIAAYQDASFSVRRIEPFISATPKDIDTFARLGEPTAHGL